LLFSNTAIPVSIDLTPQQNDKGEQAPLLLLLQDVHSQEDNSAAVCVLAGKSVAGQSCGEPFTCCG